MISMRVGSMGPDVKILQKALGISADGIYGLGCKKKVAEYQKKAGLSADGIAGQLTCDSLDIIDEIEETQAQMKESIVRTRPRDWKMYDSRWKDKMYSNHGDRKQTIGNSACGPTSGADIIATETDSDITPVETCDMALDWGCRTYNSGTSTRFFEKIAAKYGYHYTYSYNINDAAECLENGGLVVALLGPGSNNMPWHQRWTKGGHYIVLWGWDGFKYYVNDPASGKAIRQSILPYELKNCLKRLICFTF